MISIKYRWQAVAHGPMDSQAPEPEMMFFCISDTGHTILPRLCAEGNIGSRSHPGNTPSPRWPFGNSRLGPIPDLPSPMIDPTAVRWLMGSSGRSDSTCCGSLRLSVKPRERSVRNHGRRTDTTMHPPARSRSTGPGPGTQFRIPEPGWIAGRQTDAGRINAGGRRLPQPRSAYDDIAVQTGNRPPDCLS